jgi:hypothetical protein
MTARLFRCNIKNAGAAPIVFVDSGLDHGEWAEDSDPAASAGTINPGQTGHFQAESGGDIPLFDSLMTGTEGWTLFRTTNSMGSTEWFKITHCLPYWSAKTGASFNSFRYDPRIEPGSAEFDTRDLSPADISIKRISQYSPHNVLAEIQSYPWLIVWTFGQIFTQPMGNFHWHLTLEVSNTALPSPTTIPFSNSPPPSFDAKPYRFSNPDLWRGTWDSGNGRLSAAISVQDNGLLHVRVTENPDLGPTRDVDVRDVPICRTISLDIRRICDAMLIAPPEGDAPNSKSLIAVQRIGGHKFETSEYIGLEHPRHSDFGGLLDAIAISNVFKPEELGGDFLALPNDATVEIYQLKSQGTVIGYSLRYRRPTFVPMIVAGGLDEELYHRSVVK